MSATDPAKPNLRTEAIAGIITFFTMAYIVVVNPAILSTPGTGMAFSGVLTATVLVCFTMTLLMGLWIFRVISWIVFTHAKGIDPPNHTKRVSAYCVKFRKRWIQV